MLFIKGPDAKDVNYFLIRDTMSGGKPTMWSFWTHSEKIGTPDEARDPSFLADLPGEKILPARELNGDRFTAIGQYGVDMEYYIASPTDTPRSTLRWGYRTTVYCRPTGANTRICCCSNCLRTDPTTWLSFPD